MLGHDAYTLRRSRRRIAQMVAHRPSDRREALLFKSRADLAALEALTSGEREAAEAHLERVAREWS